LQRLYTLQRKGTRPIAAGPSDATHNQKAKNWVKHKKEKESGGGATSINRGANQARPSGRILFVKWGWEKISTRSKEEPGCMRPCSIIKETGGESSFLRGKAMGDDDPSLSIFPKCGGRMNWTKSTGEGRPSSIWRKEGRRFPD